MKSTLAVRALQSGDKFLQERRPRPTVQHFKRRGYPLRAFKTRAVAEQRERAGWSEI